VKPYWLLIVLLAGCAQTPVEKGREQLAGGRTAEGLETLESAVRDKPRDAERKAALALARDAAVREASERAAAAQARGDWDAAESAWQAVLALHPQNPRAQDGLRIVATGRADDAQLREAEARFARGERDAARDAVRQILLGAPRHAGALALLARLDAVEAPAAVNRLDARYQKPVSVEFRDTPLNQVFSLLAAKSGLNFVLDRDVRGDSRVTLIARDVPVAEVVQLVLATQQLAQKVLSGSSLLIYPDVAIKQKAYQDQMIRTFYIANTDAKSVFTLLKTVLKTRDVYLDEKLNLVTLQDTPEAIRLAEKLVAAQDLPDPEVLLEVEVMEVKRSKLVELGIQYPSQFTVLPTAPSTLVSLQNLRNLAASDIGVTPAGAVARNERSDVRLLANPRIRVKNREKAKIHIGDRVPVITTTATANVGISESVAYLDVGLKLDVEPTIYLHDEVAIRVALEVSNIVQEIRSAQGTLTYRLGTRNASTMLRLHDGETQMLAGLINQEDRTTGNHLPVVGDIPVLGRLFGNQRDEANDNEIVLLITPRVVRNLPRPDASVVEYASGTGARVGGETLQITPVAPAVPRPQPVRAAPLDAYPAAPVLSPGQPAGVTVVPAVPAAPLPAPVDPAPPQSDER
jgi:general secretion pathway protein D